MALLIKPFEGIGDIRFGMTREEVRQTIGLEFKSFSRSPQSVPCDYFSTIGTFCYYDSSGLLEAVELAPPAQPDLDGYMMLELDFSEARRLLSERDPGLEAESDSLIAHQIGISVYAPLAKDDPAAPIESALVFRRGYYD